MQMTELNGKDLKPLFLKYAGQFVEQQAFIAVDLENHEVYAGYNDDIGNAVPANVHDRRVLRFRINAELNRASINFLMRRILPYAKKLSSLARIEWNGSNMVGRWPQEGTDIICDIQSLCDYTSQED